MSKRTVPAKVSKRKARDERLLDFDALADFVNLGDTPEDWQTFHRKRLKFFDSDTTTWIYINAQKWWELSHLPDEPPDNWHEIFRDWQLNPNAEWAKFVRFFRTLIPTCRPPLLYYRNLLRRVWGMKKPDRNCVGVLFGIDKARAPILEETEIAKEEAMLGEDEVLSNYGHLFSWKTPAPPAIHSDTDGITWMDIQKETSCYLPRGTRRIDGYPPKITGTFGSWFQKTTYYLMQERWRARRCQSCYRFFVADKATRKYCSTGCYEDTRRSQGRDYYKEVGKAKRRENATQVRPK